MVLLVPSVISVPRSLASAASSLAAGVPGALKGVDDLLLQLLARVRPPEEVD